LRNVDRTVPITDHRHRYGQDPAVVLSIEGVERVRNDKGIDIAHHRVLGHTMNTHQTRQTDDIRRRYAPEEPPSTGCAPCGNSCPLDARLTSVRVRALTLLACVALVGAGCGVPPDQTTAVTAAPSDRVSMSTALLTSSTSPSPTPPGTAENGPNAWADPTSIDWMVPSADPPALRLIAARRELVSGCEPTVDCIATVPSATLAYDTDDLTARRSLQVVQTLPTTADSGFGVVPDGAERTLGNRTVTAVEQGDPSQPYIAVAWTEAEGLTVDIVAIGLLWDELAGVVATLTRTDPADWPSAKVQEPLGRCVDARSQYAPTIIPDGWQRFVLEAQPNGACGVATFLMMSLVIPGTADGPGTLITFVTGPASEATPQPGEHITINGNPATLQVLTAADGTPAASIDMLIGDVAINAHGNVDSTVLSELVATVGPLSDTQWAQLVSEIGAS
jgi:hypothetical protein